MTAFKCEETFSCGGFNYIFMMFMFVYVYLRLPLTWRKQIGYDMHGNGFQAFQAGLLLVWRFCFVFTKVEVFGLY